ncbi:MAG: DUF4147 domain-containing protein [Rhodobacteraceae bacterium]|nr:DUF4147 domain-containing protein [Paracoccaceae bacterium]
MNQPVRDLATGLAAVAAVGGYVSVGQALNSNPVPRPDMILAVGKAAPAMARAACDHFPDCPTLIVTKDGHTDDLPDHVRLIEASHPVPDARSLVGGRALSEAVAAMPNDSHLLLLVSGGASSLAEDLLPDHTLDDLTALNKRLLAQGLDIGVMNIERRKISRIKGGGLLAGFDGARATTLAISDVKGDSLWVIGSGIGAAAEPTAFEHDARIIASNAHARATAAKAVATVLANEELLYGDTTELAPILGKRLRSMDRGVMIFGGEPTVILPDNPGQGGRNQALALELAREIQGRNDLTVLVAGTDGTDGPTDAAGGLVDGTTWTDAGTAALAAADSGRFLADRRALFTTGPTGTNAMDLMIAIRR